MCLTRAHKKKRERSVAFTGEKENDALRVWCITCTKEKSIIRQLYDKIQASHVIVAFIRVQGDS